MKSTLLCSVLLVSGCLSVVPSTALRVAQLDPLTTDPADLTAYLTLPPGLGTIEDGNKLVLQAERDGDQALSTERYVLQAFGDGLRINPVDYERFRAQQTLIRQWKNGPGASGSLSVTLAPCAVGKGPDKDARYSVDLSLHSEGPRLPLLRNADLADLGLGDLPECTGD